MHAVEHGLESSIVFAPKVVGNYVRRTVSVRRWDRDLFHLQDMETVGLSATVPGIVVDVVEPRPAFAHTQFGDSKRAKRVNARK